MTKIFTNAEARAAMDGWHDRFRARIPGAESRTVLTRFGDTNVLIAGRADAPPLVLLHGALTGSAHVLSETTSLLDDFRIYAPDIIGQSVKSADARLPVKGTAHGEWLVDVLDGLDLARAHVYGASWGGFVASNLAAYAPERVDRLVLLVPAGFVGAAMWPALTKLTIPMLMYRAFPTRERMLRFLDPMLTTIDYVWVDYLCEASESFRLDMRIPPLAVSESFARFDRPTLVLAGADDIFFPGKELLARAKELIPHAETELLDCRHMPPMDEAFRNWLRDRLLAFLKPSPLAVAA